MTPERTCQQIREVISKLLRGSLVNHQHYPNIKNVGGQVQIGIEGAPDLSISLRNIEYSDVFKELKSAGAYHLCLIDGALVQMVYCFRGRHLESHRLCYFPAPDLPSYVEAEEYYEDDELLEDVFASRVVRVPLRFDYSSSEEEYVDVEHPKSHFSIGQYKGCRIPVNGPLTPFRFMRFLLRNFYNPAYVKVNMDREALLTKFPDSISRNERDLFFVSG